MPTPTPDELRRAWKAMSQRRSLRHWPATFEEAMADHVRARLVSIEATAARRITPTPVVWFGIDHARGPDQTAHWRPSCRATPGQIDRKRAAAGDTDRDD